MIRQWWTDHSKTIVGLAAGPVIIMSSYPLDDRFWDIGCIIGGSLIAIGLNGLWDIFFREVAKPEE